MEKEIKYSWNLPEDITNQKLEQMAKLYSDYYSKWGPKGKQTKFKLSKTELDEMLEISEMTARQAYARMLIDNKHKWATHTDEEIEFIIKQCGLKKSDKILDIGCGIGRHTNALAAKGYNVVGIDYVESFINRAKKDAEENHLNSTFIYGDVRNYKFHTKFDFVLCPL